MSAALITEAVVVGSKVWFEGECLGYTVQARDKRFLICTKPFNPRRTVLYCIVDLEKDIRGPENLVFGMGAETREQCEEMLWRLNRPSPVVGGDDWPTEVSRRHQASLRVTRVAL